MEGREREGRGRYKRQISLQFHLLFVQRGLTSIKCKQPILWLKMGRTPSEDKITIRGVMGAKVSIH